MGSIDCSIDKAGVEKILPLMVFKRSTPESSGIITPPQQNQLTSFAASLKLSSYKFKVVSSKGTQDLATNWNSIVGSYARTRERLQILGSCGGASFR